MPRGARFLLVPLAFCLIGSIRGQDAELPKLKTGLYDPDWPSALVCAPDGVLFIIDYGSGKLVRRLPDGRSFTLAEVPSPGGLERDSAGNLYVSADTKDRSERCIFRITPDGKESVFAKVGCAGLAVDAKDNLYAAAHERLYRIDKTGKPTLLVQDGNYRWMRLAVDPAGNIYATSEKSATKTTAEGKTTKLPLDLNHAMDVVIAPDGRIALLCGTQGIYFLGAGDKPAAPIPLKVGCRALAFGPKGGVFLAHQHDHAVYYLEKLDRK